MELKDTISRMLSDRYEDRFLAEVEQLYIRIKELEKRMRTAKNLMAGEPDPIPPEVLELQHKAMQAYFQSLLYRASLEGIEIEIEA